jgi:RHS repeat-associated protein
MMQTVKTYDNLNRLLKIESTTGGRPVSSRTYQLNNANQRTKRTDADGSYWDYGYDSLGQVTNAVRRWSDGALVAGQQYGYQFDDIGNRKKSTQDSGLGTQDSVYTANLLNQYTQRTVPGAFWELGHAHSNATITVAGQTNALRHGEYFAKELALATGSGAVYTSLVTVATLTTTNSAPAQAAANASTTLSVSLTNIGSAFLPKTPEQFTHDADGNLISDGRWQYTWDGENRLIAMETSAAVTSVLSVVRTRLEFVYDAGSRRIAKTVSLWNASSNQYQATSNLRFVYDGWNLLAEMSVVSNQLSVVRSYAWGLDLSGTEQGAGGIGGLLWTTFHSSPSVSIRGSHFVAFDGNGNVAALLNAQTAQTSAEYEYGPFGETIRATGPAAGENPFRFSAKYTDGETGLIYYGYRYYQPNTGRWLSRDPLGEEGGLNLFNFVGNVPSGAIDTDGRSSLLLILLGVTVGLVGGGLTLYLRDPSMVMGVVTVFAPGQINGVPLKDSIVNMMSNRIEYRDDMFIHDSREKDGKLFIGKLDKDFYSGQTVHASAAAVDATGYHESVEYFTSEAMGFLPLFAHDLALLMEMGRFVEVSTVNTSRDMFKVEDYWRDIKSRRNGVSDFDQWFSKCDGFLKDCRQGKASQFTYQFKAKRRVGWTFREVHMLTQVRMNCDKPCSPKGETFTGFYAR